MKEWRVYSTPEPGKEKGGIIIWWPEWDTRDAKEWFRENVENAGPNHFYHGATLELVEFETREERIEKERDRYRAALDEMSQELSHYPEGDGIFGHLKRILRRAILPPKPPKPTLTIQRPDGTETTVTPLPMWQP